MNGAQISLRVAYICVCDQCGAPRRSHFTQSHAVGSEQRKRDQTGPCTLLAACEGGASIPEPCCCGRAMEEEKKKRRKKRRETQHYTISHGAAFTRQLDLRGSFLRQTPFSSILDKRKKNPPSTVRAKQKNPFVRQGSCTERPILSITATKGAADRKWNAGCGCGWCVCKSGEREARGKPS